jgi:hypothetical protein
MTSPARSAWRDSAGTPYGAAVTDVTNPVMPGIFAVHKRACVANSRTITISHAPGATRRAVNAEFGGLLGSGTLDGTIHRDRVQHAPPPATSRSHDVRIDLLYGAIGTTPFNTFTVGGSFNALTAATAASTIVRVNGTSGTIPTPGGPSISIAKPGGVALWRRRRSRQITADEVVATPTHR